MSVIATRFIRRWALPGVVAAVLATVAIASPAEAATGYARCAPGNLCLFTDPNGGGAYAAFKVGSADLRNPISGFVFDNKFSSGWNRSSINFCLFAGYGYTYGNVPLKVFLFRPGDRGNIGAPFDNNVSSLKNCRA
jgi:hypothetical protein